MLGNQVGFCRMRVMGRGLKGRRDLGILCWWTICRMALCLPS